MPNESSPAEVAPLAQSVRLLRDQVDALQIAAAEKKTPWYRQMPSLAGLIALLLSVTTAVYSGVQGRKQDVQKKRESLRGIVSSLIEQGEQQAKLESTEAQKLPAQDREFIGGMINNRRMILAEAADNIVREIPHDVSSSEYNVLANDKRERRRSQSRRVSAQCGGCEPGPAHEDDRPAQPRRLLRATRPFPEYQCSPPKISGGGRCAPGRATR